LKKQKADTIKKQELKSKVKAQAKSLVNKALQYQILDNLLEGCMIIGFDWIYLYLNEIAAQHSQNKRENLIGQKMLEIYPGIERSLIFEYYQQCMKDRTVQQFVESFALADGTIAWYKISVKPIPEGIFVLSIDITEYKLLEEGLRKSEERFEAIFLKAPMGIAIINSISGHIYNANPSFSNITCRSLKKLANIDWMQITHPDDVHEDLDNMALLNSGMINGFQMEKRYLQPNGSIIWISMSVVPLNVEVKADPHHLCMIEDITERKKAEEKLKETATQLSMAAEIAKLGYWELDLVKGVFTFTDQLYAIYKTTAEEVGGYTMTPDRYNELFVFPEDREIVTEEIAKAIQSDNPYHNNKVEHRIRYATGEVGYISVHVFITKDANGRTIKTFGVDQDITERKQAEEKLKETANHLSIAANIAKLGYWEFDLLKGLFTFTDQLYAILNTTAEKVGGYNMTLDRGTELFVYHEDRALVNEEMGKFIQSDDPYPTHKIENRILYATGGVGYVSVHLFLVKDENGRAFKIYGVNQDITERKKAEKQKEYDSNNLKALINNTNDEMWSVDRDLRLITSNETFDNNVKLYTGKIINVGSNILERGFGTEQLNRFQGYYDRAFSGESFTEIEYNDNPDKSWREISFYPINSKDAVIGAAIFARDITERKKSEEALAKSENYLRTIIQSEPECVKLMDRNGFLQEMNPAGLAMLEADNLAQLKGKPVMDIIKEPYRKAFKEIIQNVFEGKSGKMEFEIMGLKGTHRWLETHAVPLTNAEGKINCLLGVTRDITGRKKAEEKLRMATAQLQHIFNTLDYSFWAADMVNNKMVYVSPGTERVYGYSEQEFMNNENLWIEVIIEEDKHIAFATFQEINKGNPVTVEYRVKQKNDSLIWVEARMIPTLDENRKLIRLDGITLDITKRKKVEEKLQESERFLNESQAVSKIGSYVLDFKTGEWKSSHELDNILGFTANEKHTVDEWVSIIHPDHQVMMQEYFTQEVVGKKQRFDKEYKLINKKTGEECWVHGIGDLEFDSIGALFKMLGTIQDISERKKIDLQLKQLNQSLEKKAAELSAANNELEQFAYIASHDLQEPLRMVSSFLQLLEKRIAGQLDDTTKKYIYFAVDGANRMKNLIQDLLEFSRTGINKESFTEVDCNEVLNRVCELYTLKIREKGALLVIKPLPVIKGNQMQIQQVFQNLVGNALKYCNPKQPEIEVGCEDKNDSWQFYVKDNGIGIDTKFFIKIFTLFQRLHDKTEYAGTGIGLSICKKIVGLHGGRIWVESEVGKGSIFYFTIPKNVNYEKEI
jgi:PAS domain S-box-containing protein